jgi:hypothetical protein
MMTVSCETHQWPIMIVSYPTGRGRTPDTTRWLCPYELFSRSYRDSEYLAPDGDLHRLPHGGFAYVATDPSAALQAETFIALQADTFIALRAENLLTLQADTFTALQAETYNALQVETFAALRLGTFICYTQWLFTNELMMASLGPCGIEAGRPITLGRMAEVKDHL